MATVFARGQKVNKKCRGSHSYPVIRLAVPSLNYDNGDLFRETHFDLVVTHEQLVTLMVAIERLEEDVRELSPHWAEGFVAEYDLEQFRVPRAQNGGLLDHTSIREWIGCIKRDIACLGVEPING
jgi:hypothetical protein